MTATPSDREAELGLIGTCLLGGAETTSEALTQVSPDHCSQEDCKLALRLLGGLLTDGHRIDETTLGQAWRQTRTPDASLNDIISGLNKLPGAALLEHFTERVMDAHIRRRLFHSANSILVRVNDRSQPAQEILNKAEGDLIESHVSQPKCYTGRECTDISINDMQERFDRQGAPTGILTGLIDLDELTDGLQHGEQTIVAARPSMGKTALGLCAVNRACLIDQIPTLFISLETGIPAIMRRLSAIHCRISLKALRKGQLTNGDIPRLQSFQSRTSKSPLHIIDGVNGMTETAVCSAIRRAVRRHGIKLVVIDYLQKIVASEKHEKRTYEVGKVSGALKAAADKCNVAMLTLAQLNRESDKGAAPRMCDLADSSQIERDADVIGLLHRERGENEGKAKLIVAKNRDGEMGVVDLTFIGQFCTFENACRQPEYEGRN